MAKKALTPSVHTDTASRTTSGGTTTALTAGFTGAGTGVRFFVPYSFTIDFGAASGDAFCYVEYTTNGGSSWSTLETLTASSPGTASASGTNELYLGTIADLSQIDLRARVNLVITGTATTCESVVTAWRLRKDVPLGVMSG